MFYPVACVILTLRSAKEEKHYGNEKDENSGTNRESSGLTGSSCRTR